MPRHRLQPGDDLLRGRRAPPVQRPPLQHPLDALGHVQPRPTHGRVDRHDPVGEQPRNELRRLVTGQVVQYQQHPQRRRLRRQRRLDRQPGLPPLPRRPRRLRRGRRVGQSGQDRPTTPASARDAAPHWDRWSRLRCAPGRRPGGTASAPWPSRCACTRAVAGRGRPPAANSARAEARSGTAPPRRSTTPPGPGTRPAGKRPRLAFFGLGVRVGDGRRTRLAAAQRRPGRTPGAALLVAVPGLMEHSPQGEGRDPRQAVRGRTQHAPQGREGPGRRAIPLRGRRPRDLAEGCGRAPPCRSSPPGRRRTGVRAPPGPPG